MDEPALIKTCVFLSEHQAHTHTHTATRQCARSSAPPLKCGHPVRRSTHSRTHIQTADNVHEIERNVLEELMHDARVKRSPIYAQYTTNTDHRTPSITSPLVINRNPINLHMASTTNVTNTRNIYSFALRTHLKV